MLEKSSTTLKSLRGYGKDDIQMFRQYRARLSCLGNTRYQATKFVVGKESENASMRMGFITGIHEDVTSLEEAFGILRREGCKVNVCLGDIVGYSVPYYGYLLSRNAHAAIRLVRSNCKYVVAGNHDYFHARKVPKNTLFRYPKNWYELEPLKRKELSRGAVFLYENELPALINKRDREFLRGLPESLLIREADDVRILISHYVLPNLVGDQTEFDPIDNGIQAHFDLMKNRRAQLAFFGHDLNGGIRFYSNNKVIRLPLGKHKLPPFPAAINGPWVANGTKQSGVMILDTDEKTIEGISLLKTRHRVPKWALK
jgi:predicted phosphodiesterase